jgi:hypothetical protein
MTQCRRRWGVVNLLIVVLWLLAATTQSYADTGQPQIHGKTYGEWSAQWWKWVRSIPDPDGQSNPITSSGAVDCSIAQAGPVWFLAGTLGGAPVVRECTVPKGKELLFPLLTLIFYNAPADAPATEAEKREVLESILSDTIPGPFNSRVCHLASTVDGASTLFSAVATTRTQSPAFRLEIGPQDVFGGTAGTVDKAAVSDGVWVMLRLPSGEHTLRFTGALCDFTTHEPLDGTQQDVTYHLLVK